MKFDFKIILFFCLVFSKTILFAQVNDSIKIINLRYDSILSSDNFFLPTLFYKHYNDVLINNVGPFGTLGYYATTSQISRKTTFAKKELYNQHIINLKGIKPFTNIRYINASRREQIFSVKHIQQFGKLFLLDFNYQRISSPGIYLNQEVNNVFFEGNVSYRSKKEIYAAKFSTLIERLFMEENGGIRNVFDFENNLFENRRTYDVNLLNSKSTIKNYHFELDQKLNIWNTFIDSTTKKQISINLNTQYNSYSRVFNDADPMSIIYNDIFIDSLSYIDSIYKNNISNQLSINYSFDSIDVSIYLNNQFRDYTQIIGLDTSYQNTYTGLFFEKKSYRSQFSINTRYAFLGYRKKDIDAELKFRYRINRDYELMGNVEHNLNEAELKNVNYQSNHFVWNNPNLEKQSTIGLFGEIYLNNIDATISLTSKRIDNLIYYDTKSKISQSNSINSFSSFRATKNYKVSNFYFRTAIIYQITSDEILFPLPKFIGRQVVYYQNYLFNKALKFQLGFNISYSSNYYGYAYMPAISEFYIQSEKKLGDYPYFDLFLNTQLKRAQIFFKYEHFNAGWSGFNYYSIPNYPSLDRSFKFGVSWNMFD